MDNAPSQTPFRLLTIGLLFLIVAALAWFLLNHSKAAFTNFVMPGDPGPFFLVDFSIAIIGLAGLALSVQSLLLIRRERPTDHARGTLNLSVPGWGLAAIFVMTLAALPAAMIALGTPAAIAIFAVTWITALQLRSGKPLISSVIIAAVSAAAASAFVQFMFIWLLATPLPA